MPSTDASIIIQRFSEAHIDGITALDIADNWMNLHRVELTVYADNAAAIGLYRKFGFEDEDLFRDYAVRDGQWVDTLSMARLRSLPKVG